MNGKKRSDASIRVKERLLLTEIENDEHLMKRSSSLLLYWTTLLVLAISNLLVAVILIPILLSATSYVVYFLIVFFGISLGHLTSYMLSTIEHLQPRHHFYASVFIPAIARITLVLIITSVNTMAASIGLHTKSSPELVMISYVSAFMLPYLIKAFRQYYKTLSITPKLPSARSNVTKRHATKHASALF